MARKKIGFPWGFCEDDGSFDSSEDGKPCPFYGKRLVDRGWGSPVCQSVPVLKPRRRLRVAFRRYPGTTDPIPDEELKRRREDW